MAIFIAIFIVILLIVTSIKNRTVKTRDKLDISYCGEVPNPNSNLHYGYGVGEELRRVSFIGFILKHRCIFILGKSIRLSLKRVLSC